MSEGSGREWQLVPINRKIINREGQALPLQFLIMDKENNKYPIRKRTRLKEYDYSNNAYYFITICINDRSEIFGKVQNNEIQLNQYGKIVEDNLLKLYQRFTTVEIDYYVIMPNHIHFIIILNNESENKFSVTRIIGAFKSITTIELHKKGLNNFKWQRSFYDRIIRNEKELYNIRQYIDQNPLRWELEKDKPENLEL